MTVVNCFPQQISASPAVIDARRNMTTVAVNLGGSL